jgi:Right handed beta helix region
MRISESLVAICSARRSLVLVVAVMAASTLGVTDSARADSIGCGSVVTASTSLTDDLQACPGDGLVVTADGVTVDLAGHTISGTGHGVGMRILSSNVLVEDGSVVAFETGIWTPAGDSPIREGVMIRRLRLANNTVDGVLLRGRSDTVEQSTAAFNGRDGVHLSNAFKATVAGNKVFRNAGIGIWGGPHSDGTLYTNNTVIENGGHGIAEDESTSAFTYNTISRNGGDGIHVTDLLNFTSAYLFAANVTNDNAGHGITACAVGNPLNPCAGGWIDGGGNAAKHNATEPQCVNITCANNRGQARIASVPTADHNN